MSEEIEVSCRECKYSHISPYPVDNKYPRYCEYDPDCERAYVEDTDSCKNFEKRGPFTPKPVRLHEVLGVEYKQPFKVKGHSSTYFIDDGEKFNEIRNSFDKNAGFMQHIEIGSSLVLCEILLYPDRIILKHGWKYDDWRDADNLKKFLPQAVLIDRYVVDCIAVSDAENKVLTKLYKTNKFPSLAIGESVRLEDIQCAEG